MKVKKYFLVEIWDRVNNAWMTVPRKIYLKVKHLYNNDATYMYDRINECPMKVSWHQYCKVSIRSCLIKTAYSRIPVACRRQDT